MNQHFDHQREDDRDELEKQLASISLARPSADYQQLPQALAQGKHSLLSKLWPWAAIPALLTVIALIALPQLDTADTELPLTLPVAELEQQRSSNPDSDNSALLASNSNPPYLEGTHYVELANTLDMSDSTTTQVTVFFWYPCSHCNAFEAVLQDWIAALPENVSLVRIPTIWSAEMRFPARAFYTAQALGVADLVHRELYNQFEQDRATINNENDLREFFQRYGVSPARFDAVFNSEEIRQLVENAETSNQFYDVQATPTIFVHGRYQISGQAGGHQEMLNVTDYLIEQIQSGN